MNEFEFIDYLATPEEQYFKGIASVLYNEKIVLRYKIVERKDGSSYFISPPNYRLSKGNDEYKYLDGIGIDSTRENDALLDMIRENVNVAMNPHKEQQQQQKQQTQNPPMPTQQHNVQQSFEPNLNECPF